ncbi:MAG: hypothetical protein MJA27_11510 [Pseudanabaenales cyanobacterium]|nr:hypothetical protein [Pseudanabaenales cyanobacterium]
MDKELTTKELERAYLDKIKALYNNYFDALLTAQGDIQAIEDAGKRFKKGLAIAQLALSNTLDLAQQLKY